MKILPKINKQKGFTLLETLVAIFVLTLAITGPIYISSFAFRNTIDSRDNISAQYLAEEVIEVIKNRRDQRMLGNISNPTSPVNWLAEEGFYLTDNADCLNDKTEVVDICSLLKEETAYDYVFEECNVDCSPLAFDSSVDATVVYGSDDPILPRSKFTREFYLQTGESDSSNTEVADKEVVLVVNIKWKERGRNKIYTLRERLYNINYVDYFTK